MRLFVRILVVALAAMVGGATTYETAVGAPTFNYDASTTVRVGGEEIATSEADRTDLEHALQTSVSPTAVARGRSTTRSLPFVAPTSALNPGRFVDGDLFQATVRANAGDVTVLAETAVSGRTLSLTDLAVYADNGTLVNQVGAREFLALRTQIANEAADAGFDTLRITGVRVPSSSSANPGHAINLTIDLSGYGS